MQPASTVMVSLTASMARTRFMRVSAEHDLRRPLASGTDAAAQAGVAALRHDGDAGFGARSATTAATSGVGRAHDGAAPPEYARASR